MLRPRKPFLALGLFGALSLLVAGALPATWAQVAGYTGPDGDRDGLPDDFEQAILEKFRPVWHFSAEDCEILPAEFEPEYPRPKLRSRNGTIYGQVFFRGANESGFFVEAHFYHLWGSDCGFPNSHPLDAEHVSTLIRALDSSRPLSEWQATHWYFAAHENTRCDSSQIVPAGRLNATEKGATIWVSWGKHAAYPARPFLRLVDGSPWLDALGGLLSPQRTKCNSGGGCGQDKCGADEPF